MLTAGRVFWMSLAGFFVVAGCWAVGSPLMSATDEASQAVKAAAVVRLDLLPEPAGGNGLGLASVPELFGQAASQQTCIAFHPNQSARCQPGFSGDLAASATAVTSVPGANPLYYLLVGWPSLFPVGVFTLYAMRLLSALLVSILAAMTVRTMTEIAGSRWIMLGTVAGLTPMAMFLGSTINPHGVDVMAGLSIWVTLLAILRDPRPDLLIARLQRFTLATVLFVNTWGVSPILLLIIVGFAVLAAPRRRLLDVLADSRSRAYLIVCAAASLASVGWILLAAARQYGVVAVPQTAGLLAATLGQTSRYLATMIGVFGWLDTSLPGWVYLLVAASLGSTLLWGLAVARRRDRVLIALLAALTVGFPVLVHLVQPGFFWQGSFLLPLAVGIPVLAGFAAHEEPAVPEWIAQNLLRLGVGALVLGQWVAFGVNLHRYVNGVSGSWLRLGPYSWRAPVSPYLLVVVVAVAWLGLGWLLLKASNLLPGPNPVEEGQSDGPLLPKLSEVSDE